MGDRYVGSLEDAATPTQMGLMSAAQAQKLANIAAGAQVNPTNDQIKASLLIAQNSINVLSGPSSYPDGISAMPVTSGNGWPGNIGGIVVTFLGGSTLARQIFYTNTGLIYDRIPISANWGEWRAFFGAPAGGNFQGLLTKLSGNDGDFGWTREPAYYQLKRTRTANQPIASGSWVSVLLNFNPSSGATGATRWVTSGDNSTFTVDEAGEYGFILDYAWDANNTGDRLSRYVINGEARFTKQQNAAGATNATNPVPPIYLPAGSTIQPQVQQTSGAQRQLQAGVMFELTKAR